MALPRRPPRTLHAMRRRSPCPLPRRGRFRSAAPSGPGPVPARTIRIPDSRRPRTGGSVRAMPRLRRPPVSEAPGEAGHQRLSARIQPSGSTTTRDAGLRKTTENPASSVLSSDRTVLTRDLPGSVWTSTGTRSRKWSGTPSRSSFSRNKVPAATGRLVPSGSQARNAGSVDPLVEEVHKFGIVVAVRHELRCVETEEFGCHRCGRELLAQPSEHRKERLVAQNPPEHVHDPGALLVDDYAIRLRQLRCAQAVAEHDGAPHPRRFRRPTCGGDCRGSRRASCPVPQRRRAPPATARMSMSPGPP